MRAAARPPAQAPLLLVEDDAPLRQMPSWDLADQGCDIAAAPRCAEARRLVERQALRFASIDVHLPDGDGRDPAFERTGRLPASDSATRPTTATGAWYKHMYKHLGLVRL